MSKQILTDLWNNSHAIRCDDIIDGRHGDSLLIITKRLYVYRVKRRACDPSIFGIYQLETGASLTNLTSDYGEIRSLPIQDGSPVFCESHGHGVVIAVSSPLEHGISAEYGIVYTVHYYKHGVVEKHIASGALLRERQVLSNFSASYISYCDPHPLEAVPMKVEELTRKHNGGPAFPVPLNPGSSYQGYAECDGMTTRDYFAAKAMLGLLQGGRVEHRNTDAVARLAYAIADAMLKEREEV